MSVDAFLGAGDLYVDRLASDGTSQGLKKVSVSKFELGTESELKEQVSKGRADFGQVVAAVNIPGKTNVNLVFNKVDTEVLAMAFLGAAAAYTQASGSVAAQVVTAIHGKFVELGKESLSAIVVQDETDTTTYTVDEDYTVDPRLGLLQVLSTGVIADAATLHVSFDHADVAAKALDVGTTPIIRCRLVFDGKNLYNDKNCKVIIPKARFSSSAVNDYLSGEFFEAPLGGLCEVPDDGSPVARHIDY